MLDKMKHREEYFHSKPGAASRKLEGQYKSQKLNTVVNENCLRCLAVRKKYTIFVWMERKLAPQGIILLR